MPEPRFSGSSTLQLSYFRHKTVPRRSPSPSIVTRPPRDAPPRLRHPEACIEDVDYRASRRLDKALFQQLARGKWIAGKQNLIVTGPCGVGKSWLACALGQKACRDDFSVLYKRVPRMFAELETGRADGRYPACSVLSPRPISSSSTIGDPTASAPISDATSWKSSRTDTKTPPP